MLFLGTEITQDSKPYIIAEISCNHEGDINKAFKLIEYAKIAGANAVKIQCYTPDSLTINSYASEFKITWSDVDINLYELYQKTQTPFEWIPELFGYARSINFPIFSSVYDEKGLEVLEKVGCDAYKIASFENQDLNLIKLVSQTNKPVIMSTGMIAVSELERSVRELEDYALLHCISSYPLSHKDAYLNHIKILQENFEPHPIGLSDHTKLMDIAPLAVALGATIIEKHLMLDGSKSHDAEFSFTPREFKLMIETCNIAYESLDNYCVEAEKNSRKLKRSIYVVEDIKKGEIFTKENIRCIRPNKGMLPMYYEYMLGKTAKENIHKGTPLSETMLEKKGPTNEYP